MKKSRYTEEQIAYAVRQAETGTPVAEVIRRMGISEQTFYRWKKVYGGLGVGELRRVKQLEDENRKLKQLVADLSLDKHILQEVSVKKALTPGRRREVVAHVQAAHGVSERRSCGVLGVDRSSIRYVSHQPDQTPLMLRIRDLAATRTRYGYFPDLYPAAQGRMVREPQASLPALPTGWTKPSAQGSPERSRRAAQAQRQCCQP